MLRLRSAYRSIITTVLLSVAFVVAANGAKTVTVSDTNGGNKAENWQRQVAPGVRQGQGLRAETLLTAQRQPRIALVIGNSAYQEDPLVNPVNDATDVAQALKDLGFEVNLRKDLNWQGMDEAIENFSKQLGKGGIGVFYYAGHGVQVKGENYLIPIDAQLKRERDVRREAVFLGDLLKFMEEAETQVNILIIDACRDNPFYRRWHSTRGLTSVRGLSSVDLAPEGTIIAFATGPGEFAEDGQGQRNSPYTSNLLKYIKNPNLEVVSMFRQVRLGVLQETNSKQRPWYRESLVGQFFFNPKEEQPTLPPLQLSQNTGAVVVKPPPIPQISQNTGVVKPPPIRQISQNTGVVKPPPIRQISQNTGVVKPPPIRQISQNTGVVKPPPIRQISQNTGVVKPPPIRQISQNTSVVKPPPVFVELYNSMLLEQGKYFAIVGSYQNLEEARTRQVEIQNNNPDLKIQVFYLYRDSSYYDVVAASYTSRANALEICGILRKRRIATDSFVWSFSDRYISCNYLSFATERK
ncbi:MAG: hypothetical protein F6K26_34500 [Moorea sp. SIO2I5]|nr:hypothetical protein [Moorena sp. SIO2I5]